MGPICTNISIMNMSMGEGTLTGRSTSLPEPIEVSLSKCPFLQHASQTTHLRLYIRVTLRVVLCDAQSALSKVLHTELCRPLPRRVRDDVWLRPDERLRRKPVPRRSRSTLLAYSGPIPPPRPRTRARALALLPIPSSSSVKLRGWFCPLRLRLLDSGLLHNGTDAPFSSRFC